MRTALEAIEIRDGRYFAALVYFDFKLPDQVGNFMGAVFRDNGERCFHFVYRFRYVVDDVLDSSSKDRKSWHSATIDRADDADDAAFEERAVMGLQLLVDTVCSVGLGARPSLIRPRSDKASVVMGMLAKQSFAHFDASHTRVPLSIKPIAKGQA